MLKYLNVKVDGTFEGCYNGMNFNADTSYSSLSSDTVGKIQSLINEIQSDGYVEIHIETNNGNNFVHKRGAMSMDAEDNVNSYELFEDMSWTSELEEGE